MHELAVQTRKIGLEQARAVELVWEWVLATQLMPGRTQMREAELLPLPLALPLPRHLHLLRLLQQSLSR